MGHKKIAYQPIGDYKGKHGTEKTPYVMNRGQRNLDSLQVTSLLKHIYIPG